MKKISISLFLCLVASLTHAQENTKNYQDAFKLIEVWLDTQKDFENIPSITAVVVKDQKTLWSGAFGKSDLEQQNKAGLSTICSICSMTKSFTAVAIMKLVDKRKLNLDDLVKDILPFYKVKQKFPEGGAVSVRSLLSHSSGLPSNTGHPYFTGPNFLFPSKKEFRSILKNMETESEVGTNVKYSNVGYALLGEIIEQVSGMPYETYLMNEVISPLKMTSTYMEMKTDDHRRAVGYTAINRDGTREPIIKGGYEFKAMKPAMGLWTSIDDLAKYASWQFRLRDASTAEILKPSTIRSMHSLEITGKGYENAWGLGFTVSKGSNGDDWVMHGGTCPGFVSMLQLNATTKMGYAIMINANRSSTFKYLNGIRQILSKVQPIKKKTNTPKVHLDDYTGFYNMNPWNSSVYISTWGEGLVVLQLPENRPKYGMRFFKHIKGDTFRHIKENGELGDEYIFERDEDGKVYRYVEKGNYKNKMNK
tara:strand:- start:73695 stop:75128 length:1434 start_codon:yes stop_codon:yes gene_type:complete